MSDKELQTAINSDIKNNNKLRKLNTQRVKTFNERMKDKFLKCKDSGILLKIEYRKISSGYEVVCFIEDIISNVGHDRIMIGDNYDCIYYSGIISIKN